MCLSPRPWQREFKRRLLVVVLWLNIFRMGVRPLTIQERFFLLLHHCDAIKGRGSVFCSVYIIRNMLYHAHLRWRGLIGCIHQPTGDIRFI